MAILPPTFVDDTVKMINSCPDCSSLEQIQQKALAQLQDMINGLDAQAKKLKDMFFEVPANPANLAQTIQAVIDLIAGIKNFIDNFVVAPYLIVIAGIIEVTTAITTIQSAVEAKMSAMSCTFTPSTPTIPSPQPPTLPPPSD